MKQKSKHEEENPEPYTGLFVSAASATLAGIVGLSLGFAGGTMSEHNNEHKELGNALKGINEKMKSTDENLSDGRKLEEYYQESKKLKSDIQRMTEYIREEQKEWLKKEKDDKIKDKEIFNIVKKTRNLSNKFDKIIANTDTTHKNKMEEIKSSLERHIQAVNEIFQRMQIKEDDMDIE